MRLPAGESALRLRRSGASTRDTRHGETAVHAVSAAHHRRFLVVQVRRVVRGDARAGFGRACRERTSHTQGAQLAVQVHSLAQVHSAASTIAHVRAPEAELSRRRAPPRERSCRRWLSDDLRHEAHRPRVGSRARRSKHVPTVRVCTPPVCARYTHGTHPRRHVRAGQAGRSKHVPSQAAIDGDGCDCSAHARGLGLRPLRADALRNMHEAFCSGILQP